MIHPLPAILAVLCLASTAVADCTIQLKDCEGESIHGVFFDIGPLSHWQSEGEGTHAGILQNGEIVLDATSIVEGESYLLQLHHYPIPGATVEQRWQASILLGELIGKCYVPIRFHISADDIASGSVEVVLGESDPVVFEFKSPHNEPVDVTATLESKPILHSDLTFEKKGSNITIKGLPAASPWRVAFRLNSGTQSIWVTADECVGGECSIIVDSPAPDGLAEIVWSDDAPYWYDPEFGAVFPGATLIEKTSGRYYSFFAFNPEHLLRPVHDPSGGIAGSPELPVAPGEYWVVPGVIQFNERHRSLVFDILDGKTDGLDQHLGSVTVQAGQKSVVSMNLADFFDWMLTYESPE